MSPAMNLAETLLKAQIVISNIFSIVQIQNLLNYPTNASLHKSYCIHKLLIKLL